MTTRPQTSIEYFRTLNILFFSLVAGQFFFAIVIVFLNLIGNVNSQGQEIKQILFLVVPIIIIGSIYASQMVFKAKLGMIKSKTDLKEKMFDYRSACIIKWAILELPGFLSLMICFWTGDLLFLGMTAIVIVYFIIMRPGLERAINDLELDFEEKMKLSDPNTVVAEIKSEV